jgi:Domain of unknown function (DUF4333)
MKGLVVLIAALSVVLLALSGCGETVLDNQKLEETLPHDLRSSVPEPIKSASCPSDIKVEKKKKFECEIVLKSGKKDTVKLEFLNDEADYGVVSISPNK